MICSTPTFPHTHIHALSIHTFHETVSNSASPHGFPGFIIIGKMGHQNASPDKRISAAQLRGQIIHEISRDDPNT